MALSTSTQYARAEDFFLLFGLYTRGGEIFLPASDELLCEYLAWQALTVDPKNLKGRLSAIRHLHLRMGLQWVPVSERYRVDRCLTGLMRLCPRAAKRKLPITPQLLIRMRQCPLIPWADPRMKVVWAAMLTAFFCFLRKDNFTAAKVDSFNSRKHLTRGDVVVGANCVQYTLRHSKTNQFGLREHTVVAPAIHGCILDAREAVYQAFQVCPGAKKADPAFCLPSVAGSVVPLTHQVFVASLRFCLKAIGVDPNRYSGHSFRRGGATFALNQGVDPLYVKWMGDWRSDAYLGYVDQYAPESLVRLPAAMAAACARMG